MDDITLIANSGIQLYKCVVEIDKNDKTNRMFHEWWDEEVQQWKCELVYQLKSSEAIYRWSDMEEHHFIDYDGVLKESEEIILKNQKPIFSGNIETSSENQVNVLFNMKLSDSKNLFNEFFDKWLPLPMLEKDAQNGVELYHYDWCRCKIIPKVDVSENTDRLSLDILIAFDTRAGYLQPDSIELDNRYTSEYPIFVGQESKKNFNLCNKPSMLMGFCAYDDIEKYLMKIIHNTTDIEQIDLKKVKYHYNFFASYILLLEILSKQIQNTFVLIRDKDVQDILVDMVVDIGNSRTSAILFDEQDFTKVKPLSLQNFTIPVKDGKLNSPNDPFDMRLAFRCVSFGDWSSIKDSTQFTWPSFVSLGKEAEYLTHEIKLSNYNDEYLSTYSSPKRYLWDDKRKKEEWRCVVLDNTDDNEEKLLPRIVGVSNYFDDDGTVAKDGFGYGYHYSRKSLMTFAFMEILSQANLQINSFEYRENYNYKNKPRCLNKIILTVPTAISKQEQKSLYDCLSDAIYCLEKFYKRHFQIQIIPKLDTKYWSFDEATCSQFVYLYGMLTEIYKNSFKDFFETYVNEEQLKKGKIKLNIGSVDIGAGTTDVMVCSYEYVDDNITTLRPDPLFWDSFNFAGDDMLQTLISNILIQGPSGIIYSELSSRGYLGDAITDKLSHYFEPERNGVSFIERLMCCDFNLQVLLPVMYYFLNLFSKDLPDMSLSFDDIFVNGVSSKPSDEVMNSFKEHFGFALEDIKWRYQRDLLSKNIEATMGSFIEVISSLLYDNHCDIVLLSGRPTSLSTIQKLFRENFAVDPNRLIILTNHRIGKWYPFSNADGFIKDTKSIVPIGAMIGYLSSNAGGYNGFSLDLSLLGQKMVPTTDYFFVRRANKQSIQYFITPTKQTGEIESVNSFPLYICSKHCDIISYPSRPFYILSFDDDNIRERIKKQMQQKSMDITDKQLQYEVTSYMDKQKENWPLKFIVDRDDIENKEQLSVESVYGKDGNEITKSDYSLTIQSLNDPNCYWLDSGEFEINNTENSNYRKK